MLGVKTPGQVTDNIRKDSEDSLAAERAITAQSTVVDNLAGHVRSAWGTVKFDRSRIDARLLDCLRRRRGEYSATKLAEIKSMGGSEIYMMIVAGKCRSAKAWLSDLFSPAGDRPFTMGPTPIPDLPDSMKMALVQEAIQVAQEKGVPPELVKQVLAQHKDRLMAELQLRAEERAENMAVAIEDLLLEGGWRDAFDEFLEDLVTYPAAIIKGLEFRRVKTLKWVNQNGEFTPAAGHKISPRVRRVSPFRAYPSPAAGSNIEDHWFIEHHTLNRADLAAMRTAPGYNSEAIAQALIHYSAGGLKEWLWSDTERAELEDRSSILARTEEIDALEYNGSIRGQMLIDWGMDSAEIPDPQEEYSVSIMIVGNYVIRALINPDPAGKSDYHKACWQPVPGSFWGTALPESMADCEDTCNATARALINNMAMSSGPMVWVEVERLAAGQNANSIHPWKVFHAAPDVGASSTRPGIQFFQPQSNASELMAVYERFNRYADDISGMPSYAHGSDAGAGAAKTASGLDQLMNAASKSIKQVVRNVDIYVIERLIAKCYNHLMLHSDDPEIKGDLIPKARGSESLVHKEQAQIRQQQLLQSTANPADLALIGEDGRREMLAEVLKTGSLPVDKILPTNEERKAAQAQMAQQQAQVPQQAPNVQ